jgi:hypothetical protein
MVYYAILYYTILPNSKLFASQSMHFMFQLPSITYNVDISTTLSSETMHNAICTMHNEWNSIVHKRSCQGQCMGQLISSFSKALIN